MMGSLASLLKAWHAAGSPADQAQLAAALERAAARVSGGALGRAGMLQPKQLLLQRVEEHHQRQHYLGGAGGGGAESPMCACMTAELPPADA